MKQRAISTHSATLEDRPQLQVRVPVRWRRAPAVVVVESVGGGGAELKQPLRERDIFFFKRLPRPAFSMQRALNPLGFNAANIALRRGCRRLRP